MRATAWTLLLVLLLGVAYVLSYGPYLRMPLEGTTLRLSKPVDIGYQPLEWLFDGTPLEQWLSPWHRWWEVEVDVVFRSAARRVLRTRATSRYRSNPTFIVPRSHCKIAPRQENNLLFTAGPTCLG